MELAIRLSEEQARHTWFDDDLTLDPTFEPQFSDSDIAEAQRLRVALGADIAYGTDDLPRRADFPEIAKFLAAHAELARFGEIDRKSVSGEIPYMSSGHETGLRDAREMKVWLEKFNSHFQGDSGLRNVDGHKSNLYEMAIFLKASGFQIYT